jgi:serine protease Do
LASQVVKQLQDFGRTRRGWLGVFIQEVTEDIAESLGLDVARGALVASVTQTGPADKAGIQAGDVIISFDGKEVDKSRDLPRIVAETEVEKTVLVRVIRNGEEIALSVTLGELEQAETGGLIGSPTVEGDLETLDDIGLTVSPLTKELAQKYGLEEDAKTIIVTAVEAEGPAASRGISEGDIIRRINQKAVTSAQQLSENVQEAKKNGRKGVLMLIESDGQTRFVQVSFIQP